MDKALILSRIKKLAGLASDVDLARFLGVTPATLSNWKARGSIDYDLVFSKCKDVNFHWLLTGEGFILRSDYDDYASQTTDKTAIETHLKEDIEKKDTEIARLNREIGKRDQQISDLLTKAAPHTQGAAQIVPSSKQLPLSRPGHSAE